MEVIGRMETSRERFKDGLYHRLFVVPHFADVDICKSIYDGYVLLFAICALEDCNYLIIIQDVGLVDS